MNTKELLEGAIILAKNYGHEYVTSDHVMHTLLGVDMFQEELTDFFKELSGSFPTFVSDLDHAIRTSDAYTQAVDGNPPRPTKGYERFQLAIAKMSMLQSLPAEGRVTVFNLLTELLFEEGTYARSLLERQSLSVDDILMLLEEKQAHNTYGNGEEQSGGGLSGLFGEKESVGSPAEILDKYTTNVTDRARAGKLSPLIGREQEVADMAQILTRKNKNNPVLVGEPGVGKTQIVEGLAKAIAAGKVPATLKGKSILSLNVGDLLAGAKYRGDFEKRVKELLGALDENKILFIDEIHTMMGAGAGSESNLDMANLLKPYLARGEISVIGATTYAEYNKHFVKDEALARRFLKIDVAEPTMDETRKILAGLKASFERHHGVTYSKDAMAAALEMSGKHIQHRFWPDKAIDLLDASAARLRTTSDDTVIEVDHIAFEVARIANLPVESLIKTEAAKMRDLKKDLGKKVFGQDEAIDKLGDSILISRAGLRGKNTTQGGFLFVGPSGCGKTEISKALGTSLDAELIRFDMSEFSEKHTVSTLIGSPPGYVGSTDSEGKLIEALEKHPSSVLLFDEVEKAHPDVFNLFLQMLDEGHITSVSSGKKVSLQNVTVILTTNLGTKDAGKGGFGHTGGKVEDGIDKAVKSFFRPEFINRLDAVVKFNTLNDKSLKSIAKKFIAELNEDTKASGVKIKLSTAAIKWLAEKGFDPKMGARPMKRLITEHIKKPLAADMLFGDLVDGGVAEFGIENGELVRKQVEVVA